MPRPHHRPESGKRRRLARGRVLPATTLALITAGTGVFALSPQGGPLAGASAAAAAHRVVLTNASNGTTTIVTQGEEVVVKLSSKGFDWTEASVINASPELVLKKESGHVSSGGTSITRFLVVGYGTATLQATGTAKCAGGRVCDPLSVTWSANVVAPVQDPPSAAA
jgi:predicted secreted protein